MRARLSSRFRSEYLTGREVVALRDRSRGWHIKIQVKYHKERIPGVEEGDSALGLMIQRRRVLLQPSADIPVSHPGGVDVMPPPCTHVLC